LAYINPELAAEANTKGNELFKEGKFPDAKKNYDEAVRRDPKNPKYYCNRGSSL
jgi:stress-induced-phosphoprotein 1